MKLLFCPRFFGAVSALLLLSNPFARADDEKPAAAASSVSRNAEGEMVVTIDPATQQRMNLEVTNPVPAVWKSAVTGYGHVIDPAPLAAAVMDLDSARLAAAASAKEYERTKTLAAEDNASPRTLESAQLAAERDRLAEESLQAKLAGDWGSALAERKDLTELIRQMTVGKDSLVRLTLPPGEYLNDSPVNTTFDVFPAKAAVPAELVDARVGVDPQTQGQMFLFLVRGHALPWGAAVTGHLGVAGKAEEGVAVPDAAVLRHDGLGWVYVRTAADQFARRRIPLDRMLDNGWFVVKGLSATNQLVSGGAESVLSAELSGGGFNTGTRD